MNLPTVSIIGAGRLGTAFGLALAARGYVIEAVVANRLSRARSVARLVKNAQRRATDSRQAESVAPSSTTPRAFSAAQLEALPTSALVFITTPDDAISRTATRLAAFIEQQQNTGRHRIALHMSGALPSSALQALWAVNFSVASLHPLIAVSDPARGARDLQRAFYCIEGDARAAHIARQLVRKLGARSFKINTKDKALYHAAAVTASGHVVALFDIAAEMLAACGLTQARARQVLLPLLRSACDNLATHEPARALTGSFARADMDVIRQHLAALDAASTALPDAFAAYLLLGARSLQLAEQTGAPAALLRDIARLLKRAANNATVPKSGRNISAAKKSSSKRTRARS